MRVYQKNRLDILRIILSRLSGSDGNVKFTESASIIRAGIQGRILLFLILFCKIQLFINYNVNYKSFNFITNYFITNYFIIESSAVDFGGNLN